MFDRLAFEELQIDRQRPLKSPQPIWSPEATGNRAIY